MYSTIPIHWNIESAPASPAEVVLGQLSMYLASWVFPVILGGVYKQKFISQFSEIPGGGI
jgi:hypothetical protein